MVRYKYSGKVGEKISVTTSITDYGDIPEEKWVQPKIVISNVAYRPSGYSKNADQMWGIFTKATGHGSLEYTMEKWLESYDFYIDVYNPTYQGYALYDNNGCGAISGSVPVRITITSDAKTKPTPTPTPSKTRNRTSGCTPCAEMAGEPVQTGTGEYFTDLQTDINLGGPLPLTFTRYYASRLNAEGAVESVLGDNWMHNFDLRLKDITDDSLDVVHSRGKIISFEKSGSDWKLKNAEETVYQLQKDTSGDFYLMDPSKNLVYHFDGTKGYLEEIKDRSENTLTLTRGSSGKITEISDDLGRTLSFTHNSSGNLTQISDGTRTLTYGYTDGALTEFTDALGNTTTYVYDEDNTKLGPLMTYTIYPGGNRHHVQTYDSKGRAAKQEDAFGNVYTFKYDNSKKGKTESTVTDPLGNKTKSAYQDQKVVTRSKDAMGKTSKREYDENDKPTSFTDKLGNTTTITYDEDAGMPASITDAGENTGNLTYGKQEQTFSTVTFTFHNLTQIDYPDGTHENFVYDTKGNQTEMTDQMGNVWSYTYNLRGQVLTEINPEGGVTTFTYNSDGTLASSSDSDIGANTYEYDSLQRLVKTVYPDGSSRQIAYDENDRVTFRTDELSRTTTFAYDTNGNPTTTTLPNGNSIQYTYDKMDRLTETTDRLGNVTATEYDELGRMAFTADPNGNSMSYTYNDNGWITKMTDADGKVWETAYNDVGLVTSETTPLGATVHYEKDATGNTTKTTDPMGNSIRFTYDSRNRVITTTNPNGRKTEYTYDNLGMISGVSHDGLGVAVYARNTLGNLTSITDLNGKVWLFGYTAMGRLALQEDPLGNEWTYTYDSKGSLSTTTFPAGETKTVTYDSVGNITQINYSGKTTHMFTYDSLSRMVSADDIAFTYDAEGNITNTRSGDVDYGATYDDGGRLHTVTYNNGTFTVTYAYNSRDLLTEVTDSLTNTTLEFDYDDDKKLKGISRSNGISSAFTYDKAARITDIKEGSIASLQYTYNASGAIIKVNMEIPLDPAGLIETGTSTFSYNEASQINSSGYTYDKRGRQTASPVSAFTWDDAGRLSGVGEAAFEYNGLGYLVRREEGGTTIRYYCNAAMESYPVMAEQDSNGQWLRYYVCDPEGHLLYMIDASDGNKVYFYHADHAGSVLFLTDSSGAVTDAYAYDPYGKLLGHEGSSQQPFTFIGKYGVRQEGNDGLYQMRARYYDAVSARFISRDSAWPQLGSWDGLNPYLYARANPLSFVDTTGKGIVSTAGKMLGKTLSKSLSKEAGKRMAIVIGKELGTAAAETTATQAGTVLLNKNVQPSLAELEDQVLDPFFIKLKEELAPYTKDFSWKEVADELTNPVNYLPTDIYEMPTMLIGIGLNIGEMREAAKVVNIMADQSKTLDQKISEIEKLEYQYGGKSKDDEAIWEHGGAGQERLNTWSLYMSWRVANAALQNLKNLVTLRDVIDLILCQSDKEGVPSTEDLLKLAAEFNFGDRENQMLLLRWKERHKK